jgi:RimJ/RimL family protein N-acetyltransferase
MTICASVLESDRLRLRRLETGDVTEAYCRWMNDSEVTRHLECRFQTHTLESLREYVGRLQDDADNFLFAILLKQEERHIGNIKLGPVNWTHRFADLGLLIGEKDCWDQGYATEAIRLLRRFAFDELGLHKLQAGCYDTNPSSARAFQKAGFVKEGHRRAQFLCEGRYVGQLLLGCVNPAQPLAA